MIHNVTIWRRFVFCLLCMFLPLLTTACQDNSDRTIDDLILFLSDEFDVSNETSDFLYMAVLAIDGRRVTLGGTDVELFKYDSAQSMESGREMMARIAGTVGMEFALYDNGMFLLSINSSVVQDMAEADRITRLFLRF